MPDQNEINQALGWGFVQASIEHNGMGYFDSAIEHSGRKGMKWYQHIYGEPDSRAKYASKGSNSGNSSSSSSASKIIKSNKPSKEEILMDPDLVFKYRSDFTKDELKDAVDRFRLENEVQKISIERRNQGVKKVTGIMDMAGDTVEEINKKGQAAVGIWNTFAGIYNVVKAPNAIPLIQTKARKG